MSRSTFHPGTKIQITGLQTAAVSHLNGVEGVVERFSKKRGKYVVMLPEGPMMVNTQNMKVTEAEDRAAISQKPSFGSIFRGEEDMMQRLRCMGMSEQQLGNLTAEQRKAMLDMTMRQDIIQRAQDTPGVIVPSTELTMEGSGGGLYGWRDSKTHVYLEMTEKVGSKGEGGGFHCAIEEDTIHVTDVSSGDTLLQGDLFQTVDVSKSVWEVTPEGKLVVTLIKAKPMRWLMVTKS